MKKYILIISILILFVTLSCTKEGMDFDTNGGNGKSFVHFVGTTQNLVTRYGEIKTLEIAISSTSLSDVSRTYNLNIVDSTSTAIEGVHYVLSSKTITIPAGQYSGFVTITADDEDLDIANEVFVDFSIDSEDFISYGKTQTIYLRSFFEVSVEWLVGDWSIQDYDDGEEDGGPYTITMTKIDDETVGIYDFWGWGETITAKIDADNSIITIEPNAFIYDHPTYGPARLIAVIDGAASTTQGVVGDCTYSSITLRRYAVQVAAGYFVTNGTSVLTKL